MLEKNLQNKLVLLTHCGYPTLPVFTFPDSHMVIEPPVPDRRHVGCHPGAGIKAQVCSLVELLVTTLFQAYAVFYLPPEGGPRPGDGALSCGMLFSILENVTSSAPAGKQSSTNSTTHVHFLITDLAKDIGGFFMLSCFLWHSDSVGRAAASDTQRLSSPQVKAGSCCRRRRVQAAGLSTCLHPSQSSSPPCAPWHSLSNESSSGTLCSSGSTREDIVLLIYIEKLGSKAATKCQEITCLLKI